MKTSNNITKSPISSGNQCKICDLTFVNRYLLKRHEKKHLAKRDFGCNICGENFESKPYLNLHLKSHGDYKKFECLSKKCRKKYDDAGKLTRHLESHTKKKFKCTICLKWFKTLQYVKRHQLVHVDGKDLKFECPVCGKKFSKKPIFSKHWRSHLAKKFFQCTICDNEFNTADDLRRHQKKHKQPDLVNP